MVEIKTINGLPRDVSCRMEVLMKDGSKFTSQVDYPKGSIQNPMTPEERRNKFIKLSSDILSEEKQKKLEERVFEIEKIKDVSELFNLVVR